MTDARIFTGTAWQSLMGPPGPVTVVPVTPPSIPSGPNADALPAIQALIDAAQAITDADMTAFVTVKVPQQSQPSYLGGPLYIDGRNISGVGDGPGSRIAGGFGGYGGPAVVLGVSRLERLGQKPTDYRVASVLGGGRQAISTKGTAVLSVTAHNLQLGAAASATDLTPDGWQAPAYTYESIFGPSDGTTWTNSQMLFGLCPYGGAPAPWGFFAGADPTTVQFFVRTASQLPTQFRTYSIPTPGPWPHAVTVQWDSATATVTAWVDKVQQPVTSGSTDPTAWVAGDLMARGAGETPFLFGGFPAAPTPVDIHALIVSVGKKYDPTKATETRLDGLPIPPSRYWDRPVPATATKPAPATTIAFMPLDDVPATHVPIDTNNGGGVGFWIPLNKDGSVVGTISGNLALKDLNVSSRGQQAIAVGACYGLTFTDVIATGMQGIGSTSSGEAYPVILTRPILSGADCAYFGWRQILRACNATLPQVGNEGVRCQGGDYSWRDTVSTFHSPNTRFYFRSIGDGYGGIFEVDGAQVDNEDGGNLIAVVDAGQAPYRQNRVIVRRIAMSTMNAAARFVRVTGSRTKASGDTFPVGLLDISELICDAGFGGTAVEITGTPGSWMGTFNPNGLNNATVAGQTQNLMVIPLVVPIPAQ